VAERLGIDLTTVSRAYAAAAERGLLEGAVGRGTYVRRPAAEDEAGLIDLSMNLPPPPAGVSLGRLLSDTAADILRTADPAVLMAYHPGFGTFGQKSAAARWLAPTLGEVLPERLLITPGAQPALAAVLCTLCRAGDTVVTEPLTYPGLIAVAQHLGLRLLACPVDAAGPVPEALEAICARERPAALYLVPTLQNPTATTVPVSRRRALAEVAERHGLWVVEDDPYSPLLGAPPPSVASLLPQRTFHIATLAKCVSPGLRIAYLVCPADWSERTAHALRAAVLMPPPLMAAIATRWINDGTAEALLGAVRAEARARRAIAAEVLPQAQGAEESLHVWLPLSDKAASDRLRQAGRARGLAIATAEDFAVGTEHPPGARISVGAPASRALLRKALLALAELLAEAAVASRAFV
jgi:DNA-binding transcriptional MocR family regulator